MRLSSPAKKAAFGSDMFFCSQSLARTEARSYHENGGDGLLSEYPLPQSNLRCTSLPSRPAASVAIGGAGKAHIWQLSLRPEVDEAPYRKR